MCVNMYSLQKLRKAPECFFFESVFKVLTTKFYVETATVRAGTSFLKDEVKNIVQRAGEPAVFNFLNKTFEIFPANFLDCLFLLKKMNE